MNLDERKKKILGAIIDSYIQTAEPVGSRTISKLHNLDLSPATIRNEMADLEDMGLLEQPHTSAGRIPSHLGYRTYVDRLMTKYQLTNAEISKLHSLMELQIAELDTLVKEIANIYSRLTNYTVIGISPALNKGYIKNFHMVPIDEHSVLLIVVTDNNIVRNKKITFDMPVDSALASKISDILNEKLAGVTNDNINLSIITELQAEMDQHQNIIMPILNFINECIESMNDADIFLGGASNLLNFPEYSNVKRAKELLEFLDNKNNLHKAMAIGENQKVKIIIGSENEALELHDCSVVLSTYSLGGVAVGTIGLIGPTRMDYSKAVSNLEFFTQQLDKLIPKIDTEGEK